MFRDLTVHRFDTIAACDGRTDGQTDKRLDNSQDAQSITCCRT